MFSPPHEVYSRCLLGAYGYPLWTPQLKRQLHEDYQLGGLKIGDVGVISPIDGSFDVLFNITLEHNEQPFPNLVREDFMPIVLDPQVDLVTQDDALSVHEIISSTSVEVTSHEVHSCDQKPPRANYELTLSMKDGAVLILPEGAESCDLANEKKFLEEAIRHGMEWYKCVTEDAGRPINDSLYLITGFHKAPSWSLGAARRNDSNPLGQRRSVKFRVGELQHESITAGAYLWTTTHGFTGRVGPMCPYEISNYIRDRRLRRGSNQTVFIRGFRITVNKFLFLKTLSVKTQRGTFFGFSSYLKNLLWGSPSISSSTQSATDNLVDQDSFANHDRLYMDTLMTIDRMSDVYKAFHPGDLINQYLLKREPRAMVAVTHDNLWIEMLQMGLLELADFSCERRLEEVLSKHCQITTQDGAVYPQIRTNEFSAQSLADIPGLFPRAINQPPSLLPMTTHLVSGDHPIRGRAEPLRSSSLRLSPSPSITSSSYFEPPRKKRALLIAIQHVTRKTEAKFSSLPDLRLSHRDAKALRECLIDSHGYHPDDITLMMDDRSIEEHLWPTRDRVLRQIDLLTSNAPENCHFFFYFSGHGLEENGLEEDGGERASVRADGQDDGIVCADAKPILDHILHDRLVTPLQNVTGSKLVVLLDCSHEWLLLPERCIPLSSDLQSGSGPNMYSRKWTIGRGQLFKSLASDVVGLLASNRMHRKGRSDVPLPQTRTTTKRRGPPISKTKEVGEPSVICLSACRKGQLAHDDCEREITFTKYVMDVMARKPRITWGELCDELKNLVSDIQKRYKATCMQDSDAAMSSLSHSIWTQEPTYYTTPSTDLTRQVSL